MCCDYCCDNFNDGSSKCDNCGDTDREHLCDTCWTSFSDKSQIIKDIAKDARLGIIKGHFRDTITLSELAEILEKL